MSWNFALILFVLLVLTGAIWVLDLAVLRRGAKAAPRPPWPNMTWP